MPFQCVRSSEGLFAVGTRAGRSLCMQGYDVPYHGVPLHCCLTTAPVATEDPLPNIFWFMGLHMFLDRFFNFLHLFPAFAPLAFNVPRTGFSCSDARFFFALQPRPRVFTNSLRFLA